MGSRRVRDKLLPLRLNQPPINPITAGPTASNDVIHLEVEQVWFDRDSKERAAPRAVPGHIVDHTITIALSPACSR